MRIPLLSYRMAAIVAFVAVFAIGATSLRERVWRGDRATAELQSQANNFTAFITGTTACQWDGVPPKHGVGSGIQSGESLHLLEGLARFDLSWGGRGFAALSLEGPAALVFTSEGMPSMRFGRLNASVQSDSGEFRLETPIGKLRVPGFASIGVSAFGNEGEVHVFGGSAVLEAAWSFADQTVPIVIEPGRAIRIKPDANGVPQVTHHAADGQYFAAHLEMDSQVLTIPKAYVRDVQELNPVGYWRFERDAWPLVPNEMGPRFACRVQGELAQVAYNDNHAVEFGLSDVGGAISSAEAFDGVFDKSYSVECWVKPSHYHFGAMVSLIGAVEDKSSPPPHGMLLELGGSGSIPTAIVHPGRIRFLHRSPPSRLNGTSCFSKKAYQLRKWQHVVATKEGAKMALYINGKLAARGMDEDTLPTGLTLLVGRLYPYHNSRTFAGQLDELAIYDKALKPEEITRHYELARPRKPTSPSI